MKELILLIDDDRLPMKFYVRALEDRGFAVKLCLEPNSALDFALKEGDNIDVIILDIMLPPGKYGIEETNEGLKTGVFLLDDLRKKEYCPNTPIVVLTNVRDPKTLLLCSRKKELKVVQKMDCPPFELATLVEEIVRGNKS